MKILKILFLIIMIAFGIFSVGCFTSVEDFNRIFPNAAISQNPKNGEDSSLDPIL